MHKKIVYPMWIVAAVLFIARVISATAVSADTPGKNVTFVTYLPGLYTQSMGVTSSFGSAAAFTTVNEAVDGAGHCKNGNPNVNCNIYDGKQYVWLNGGPAVAYLGDGNYFFAVLEPGGQADPNDKGANNLSDETASPWPVGSKNADGSSIPGGDPYTNRTFTVTGKKVVYGGDHDFDKNKIRLMPYDDTPNPGGVYIIAICSLANGYPVDPSTCKYDAFKIQNGQELAGVPLYVTKDADGDYKNTFTWAITKGVDKTLVKQVGGSVTFDYTVQVTHDNGTTGDVTVTGKIRVFNPNVDSNNNTVPVTIGGVTDQLSSGFTCTVTNGGTQSLTQFETDFAYACDLGDTLPQGELDNTAAVSWPEQILSSGALLKAGSASFTFSHIEFAETKVDGCVSIDDNFGGNLGTVCVGGVNPTTIIYSHDFAVPQFDCVFYTNTVTFTTDTSGATGSASQAVEVCGPIRTGALTMGFWQNKNGQGIIKGGLSTDGVCSLAVWMRQYAPFQDLNASATCSDAAAYVYSVIKAANASGDTMNAMLKAQMLATALDVYFSDPALGGNKIKAPRPIGGVEIDLLSICKTFTFCNTFEDVSPAFGGAASIKISDMLVYAAGQSNAGGSLWYANDKAMQGLAKDAFDAINNEAVFAP